MALLAACLLLPVVAACGDDDDDSGDGPSTPVDTRIGKEETANPTGEVDPATGLPDSFPEDFPVYEGAELSRASEYEQRYLIEWHTPDEVGAVRDYYTGVLGQDPWVTSETQDTDDVRIINFTGDLEKQYSGTVAVAPSGESETQIILNLSFVE